jgi:hypothetical protein
MRFKLMAGGCVGIWLCAAVAQAEPLSQAEWTPADNERLHPHHWRSLIEMGSGLVAGTGGYWLLKNKNLVDWDNPSSRARFDGAAWVLDNNSIAVNFLFHPLTGALSYDWARGNHQSVAGAFGYSFLTSFIWEFVIEFKEKVSINDVIVTPGAGLPIGEFFHKLGLYLDTGHHDSLWVAALRGGLGHGVALDRALDGRAPPLVTHRDSLGFSAQIWHDFELRYGVSEIASSGVSDYARFGARAQGKLVTLPGYGAKGSFARGFWGAELSSFALATEASRHGAGVSLTADTMLAGYHTQDLTREAGVLQGESFTLGSSVGYDFLRSSANRYEPVERAIALPAPDLPYQAPNRREQYSALQLPGISGEFRLLRRRASLEGAVRLQPSFAGLGAPAFYEWAAENLDEISKHILHRQGYFYGWGGALSGALRARAGAFRGDLELFYATYTSQDGLDRHANELTVDTHASGSFLSYRTALGVAPGAGWTLALELGGRRWQSKVGGFGLKARSLERGLSAKWNF